MEEDRATNQRSAFSLSFTLALYISDGFGLSRKSVLNMKFLSNKKPYKSPFIIKIKWLWDSSFWSIGRFGSFTITKAKINESIIEKAKWKRKYRKCGGKWCRQSRSKGFQRYSGTKINKKLDRYVGRQKDRCYEESFTTSRLI